MRDILAHRIDNVETFSILSTMSFKTEEHAISSILIHDITSQAGKAENEDALANLVCDILTQQWNRCLREEVVRLLKYFANQVHSLGLHSVTTELPSPSKLFNL